MRFFEKLKKDEFRKRKWYEIMNKSVNGEDTPAKCTVIDLSESSKVVTVEDKVSAMVFPLVRRREEGISGAGPELNDGEKKKKKQRKRNSKAKTAKENVMRSFNDAKKRVDLVNKTIIDLTNENLVQNHHDNARCELRKIDDGARTASARRIKKRQRGNSNASSDGRHRRQHRRMRTQNLQKMKAKLLPSLEASFKNLLSNSMTKTKRERQALNKKATRSNLDEEVENLKDLSISPNRSEDSQNNHFKEKKGIEELRRVIERLEVDEEEKGLIEKECVILLKEMQSLKVEKIEEVVEVAKNRVEQKLEEEAIKKRNNETRAQRARRFARVFDRKLKSG